MKKSILIAFFIVIISFLIIFLLVNFHINNKKIQINGLIVNHHLFASNLIDQTFSAAADNKPSVIVLISPNHFNFGKYQLLTTQKNWPTIYGELTSNKIISYQIINNSDLKIEDLVFEKEHGIFNIIPYLKKYYPESTVVPIIIKETISNDQIDELASQLNNILPADALIIGSFDFSHNKIDAEADKNDEKSLMILQNLDYLNTIDLDIDSTKGLRLVLEYLFLKQTKKFQLIAHSSSAKITNNLTTTENTSYIDGIFTN